MGNLETLRNLWLGLTTTLAGRGFIAFMVVGAIIAFAQDLRDGRKETNERCRRIRERRD